MSATLTVPPSAVMPTRGFAELTVKVGDVAALERFRTGVFGLEVPVGEDAGDVEGDAVEVTDFIERGPGRRESAAAPAGHDAGKADPSS